MALFGCRMGLIALMLVVGMAPERAAQAQTYPAKPIHIIVPFAPGGITDVIARALGQRLSEAWKQQVVVENRPTGAGIVGVDAVASIVDGAKTVVYTGCVQPGEENMSVQGAVPANETK